MDMIYENKLGEIKFCGRGSDEFSVCEIEGIEPCEKNRVLRSYIGEDGHFEESSQYMSRIISFSGDIKGDYQKKFRFASKILSEKGTLYINQGDYTKKITVDHATLKIGKKYNNYCTYAIQLTCDYPHFTDVLESVCGIFVKKDFLTNESVLPTVFSERISRGTVNNLGDLKIYPKIIIENESETEKRNSIEIINETTGKKIILEKELKKNEEIVVDVKNRTITSSFDGNIIGTLDFYSSLKDMWCECGENVISVLVDGEQKGIKVLIKYYNEYLEAI